MNDTTPKVGGIVGAAEEHCAQCVKLITPDDRVATGDKVFCNTCYADLRGQLETAVQAMSSDIRYPNAVLGAVLGGAAGALVWWGFTAVTRISLGLVAVGIGFAVGWATVRFAGEKRSGGLQVVSVTVATLSYLVATYLVNMTFINHALAGKGGDFRVLFPPQNVGLAVEVVRAGFDVMDVVFLAIVVYEAWKIPRPISLPRPRVA